MLPVQDVIPSRTTPWITIGLIGVLAAVLVGSLMVSDQVARGLIVSYGLIPAHASWYAWLTAALLHYGVVDAGTNALALWIFGDNVEDRLGRWRYGFLLLAGIAVSALVGVRLNPESLVPAVGAGGAVGAVIGAHLVLLPGARVLMLVPLWREIDLVEIPAALVILGWLLLAGLIPGTPPGPAAPIPPGVVVQLAGLVTGAACARLLARPERLRCGWWNVASGQPPDRRRTSRDTSASSASSASN